MDLFNDEILFIGFYIIDIWIFLVIYLFIFRFGTIGIGILIYFRNRDLFIRVLWDLVFFIYLFLTMDLYLVFRIYG